LHATRWKHRSRSDQRATRSRAIERIEEAAAYLEGLIDVEKQPDVPYERLGLGPIRNLLARLGDPHIDLPVIHIAGSKGKGSTALFVEAVALAAGERVGTFTSPHLERWTERFRIGGCEVAGERLAAAVARLRPHVDAMRAEDRASAPTFFDATTAAALLLFAEADLDRVVLEVGLGGRLDSTNVVTPAVTCVTSIELEHTDKLGHDIGEIAGEKAGILKPGVPAVAGQLPAAARLVLERRAKAVGCEVAWLAEDFTAEIRRADSNGLLLMLRDGPIEFEVELPVLGSHQAANAALALACARRAGIASDEGLASVAQRGLASVRLPGRVEVLGHAPTLIVDSAHTAVSAAALAAVLEPLPRRHCHLVLSISAGKDADSILSALLPGADSVTVTCAEPLRSLAPEALAAAVRGSDPELELRIVPDPQQAVRTARADLAVDDLLCVTGSVYLAGVARGVLSESSAGAFDRSVLGGS
jgi:dihydrofolate synthase/folylpolyglutamate synthase